MLKNFTVETIKNLEKERLVEILGLALEGLGAENQRIDSGFLISSLDVFEKHAAESSEIELEMMRYRTILQGIYGMESEVFEAIMEKLSVFELYFLLKEYMFVSAAVNSFNELVDRTIENGRNTGRMLGIEIQKTLDRFADKFSGFDLGELEKILDNFKEISENFVEKVS